ncbi:MAG TPA: hypothetical protein VMJ32_08095 [Pirellulales bacterium]|nr:hypothetical protein [Pirellulales bacterium]
MQKDDDEAKSTVPDCHNLFFMRLAESIGRLAGEWLAKMESAPNHCQDTLGPSETPATISVQGPIDSAEVSEAGSQHE